MCGVLQGEYVKEVGFEVFKEKMELVVVEVVWGWRKGWLLLFFEFEFLLLEVVVEGKSFGMIGWLVEWRVCRVCGFFGVVKVRLCIMVVFLGGCRFVMVGMGWLDLFFFRLILRQQIGFVSCMVNKVELGVLFLKGIILGFLGFLGCLYGFIRFLLLSILSCIFVNLVDFSKCRLFLIFGCIVLGIVFYRKKLFLEVGCCLMGGLNGNCGLLGFSLCFFLLIVYCFFMLMVRWFVLRLFFIVKYGWWGGWVKISVLKFIELGV